MIKLKLSFPSLEWPLAQQTPNSSGVWNNCQFFINTPIKRCDYWVVYEGLTKKKEKTVCPRENTILITAEPPTLKEYNQQFLNQFNTVITCHHNIKHKNPVFQQQGLPWHVGRQQKNHINLSFSKDYDELMSIQDFHKDKLISVISSAKDFSAGHRQRIKFLNKLKDHFGDQIDAFGRGYREIEDKWDALARYKYHVALENSSANDYWTEKLGDAYLAGCYPIYYGCPNIEKYFDPSALTVIDITNPEEAIRIIESCINESRYESAKQKIEEAKNDVLNRYNLFAIICEYINTNPVDLKEVDYVQTKINKEPSKSNIFNRIKSFVEKIRSHANK